MKTFIVSAVIAALAASAEVDCDEYDTSTDTESYINYCLDFWYETACLYTVSTAYALMKCLILRPFNAASKLGTLRKISA